MDKCVSLSIENGIPKMLFYAVYDSEENKNVAISLKVK